MTKEADFDFYEKVLGSPRHVLAPMVDASELAWRMLARRYNTHLCYTPMWHSGVFVRDERYRREALQTCGEDRPLIIQFCANNPDTFRKAVELTLKELPGGIDAVDLNLGCPQIIAKRGRFGSYLQDEWDLVSSLVRIIAENFSIPITAKIRIFDGDLNKTIKYAKMLESSGCRLLTVHGRHRDQKGALTGIADWQAIKAVVEALNIPVIANGNIRYFKDVDRCLKFTGAMGVMSAEGHLSNPAIFSDQSLPVWSVAQEYFDLVEKFPCPLSYVRGHIFKLCHHILRIRDNFDVRDIIAKGSSINEFKKGIEILQNRYEKYTNSSEDDSWKESEDVKALNIEQPPWICQPYVRPPPEVHIEKMKRLNEEQMRDGHTAHKRTLFYENLPESERGLSKKKIKRLRRNPNKKFNFDPPPARPICKSCPNPKGTKCDYDLCRKCCKGRCFHETLDCEGHKVFIKTKKEQKLKIEVAS